MAVVEATAAFAASKNRDLAARIEMAMSAAALEARSDGVTDPNEVRQRMLEARDRIKNAE